MLRKIFSYLAVLLFFYSLLLPAFTINTDGVMGISALIYGWALVPRFVGLPWVANLLFVVTLLLFFQKKRKARLAALYTGAAALLFAASFLLVTRAPGEKTEPLTGMVTRKIGYWLWLGSMVSAGIAAVFNYSRENIKPGKSKV